MNDTVFIDESIPQWKGNFHTHTTLSDGKETPDNVVDIYKKGGYNFLAISDHELYFDTSKYDDEKFTMLGGIECAIEANPDNKWLIGKDNFTIHLNGIYDHSVSRQGNRLKHLDKIPRSIDTGIDSWQKQIEIMRNNNLIVFLNHPRWSRIRPDLMLSLHGYIATEVYNFGCAVAECTAASEYEWDYCLQNGKHVYCVATDDAHRYTKAEMQALGGFTMVQCDTLNKASLCTAIKNGFMYASSGPKILDMRVKNNVLKMKFTPSQHVNFVAYDGYIPVIRSEDNSPIESIELPLNDKKIKYFRPEVVGLDGSKAWGQPIFL